MEKNELFISNDDLFDVFDSVASSAGKKGQDAAKPSNTGIKEDAKAQPVKSKLIMDRAEEAYRAQQLIAEQEAKVRELPADDLVRRAAEIEKELAVSAPDLTMKDFTDEKTAAEIAAAFNGLKECMLKELEGKIEKRAVDNMLARSLDRTAAAFSLLRNTGWNENDDSVPEGTINTEKFGRNMTSLKETVREMDKEIEETLKALLVMRLVAVKKGLGPEKYGLIRGGMTKRFEVAAAGYRSAVAKFIRRNVLENSFRKADEAK